MAPQTDNHFRDLMNRVLAGSDEAARELFDQYEPVLLHAIRRRLNKKIRPKFDSRDLAQDVWKSFFAGPPEKRTFKDSEALVKFLTCLAQNKVVDVHRERVVAQKHDVNREQSLDDSRNCIKVNLIAQQPTPSENLMDQEAWSDFLRKQPLVYRRIFILLREGKSPEEIAQVMDINARTVRRVIADRLPQGGSHETGNRSA